MSSAAIQLPIQTELPPALHYLANPVSSYLNAYPPYNNIALGALIFTPPPWPPRILLLQNAGGGTDPNAFSHYWQVPIGKPILADATLVHTLSRLVREQTGLQLAHVVTMVGTEEGPRSRQTGNIIWMKMLFVVEVTEFAPQMRQISNGPEADTFEDVSDDEPCKASMEEESDLDSVQVRLNPAKHVSHVWAPESDLKGFIDAGLYPVEERVQYHILLEAFALYRQDFAHLEQLRWTRQNVVSAQGLWS